MVMLFLLLVVIHGGVMLRCVVWRIYCGSLPGYAEQGGTVLHVRTGVE